MNIKISSSVPDQLTSKLELSQLLLYQHLTRRTQQSSRQILYTIYTSRVTLTLSFYPALPYESTCSRASVDIKRKEKEKKNNIQNKRKEKEKEKEIMTQPICQVMTQWFSRKQSSIYSTLSNTGHISREKRPFPQMIHNNTICISASFLYNVRGSLTHNSRARISPLE